MKREDRKPLNIRIARCRSAAGYSQKAAAKALGIKESTYGRLEREGNPSPDVLAKMAELYNVDIVELLYDKEQLKKKDEKRFEELQKSFTRLHDSGFRGFEVTPKPDFSPTERNLIGGYRDLTKEQQTSVVDLINKLRNENKNKK